MNALINVILPVFIIVALGFVLGKLRVIDIKPLSTVAIYLMIPCLVISSFTRRKVESGELTQLIVFTVLVALGAVALAWVIARMLHLDRRWESALILSSSFGNVGNFGLPLALFAFGDVGLQQASIVFVASGILSFSLGIFIASRGTYTPVQAFLQIFKMPPIYATTTALIINAFNITLPDFINRPLIMLGDGSIPLQLVMVGVGLAGASLKGTTSVVGWAVAARLVGGVLLGALVAAMLGLDGVARQAAILQMAMPAAVNSSIFAVQFDLHPEFVASVVVVSTLCSLVTLTVVLNLL
ncbi:MAG: AEC family transporter [Chloroflexi bacterium]|nr:AEC family transporter [Chloroflexota bacterium]